MTDKSTKAVAARLPLNEYVKIIRTATELKLSVSEYVILKLHSSGGNEEIEGRLREVTSELARTKKKLDEALATIKALQQPPASTDEKQAAKGESKPPRAKKEHPRQVNTDLGSVTKPGVAVTETDILYNGDEAGFLELLGKSQMMDQWFEINKLDEGRRHKWQHDDIFYSVVKARPHYFILTRY